MASGTFRSDSSASTTMNVNIYEIWRSGTMVGLHCAWSVTTGSASSLGSGSNRTLYIMHVNGTQLAAVVIKNGVSWAAGSTYSGGFDFSVDIGTYNAGTCSMIPHTSSEGTQSCIWTQYVGQLDVSFSETWSDASAPSSPVVGSTPFESSVELRFNAGSAGANNPISAYHLYYRINGGSETGINIGLSTSYTLDTSGIARGSTLDFHVATVAAHNTAWSGWSNAGRKNSAPYAPTSPSVPKSSYIPGEAIVVSFANNGDYDSNNAGFEVATDQNETIVGSVANGSATSVSVDTTGWQQGITRKFRVRAYDALGVRSDWSNYTQTVTLNTAPNPSVISFPAAGSTVYNKRPHILLKAGAVNDGPYNILCLTDTAERMTATDGSVFSCGTNSYLTTDQQVVYQPLVEYASVQSVSSRMHDTFLFSASVTRTFNVATFAPTDANLAVSGMMIKAVHVTDIRAAINKLRTAYGLAAFSWTSMTAGVTKIGNSAIITEMQTALQAVINVINGWASGSAFDISVTWINPASGGGVDRVKLRQAIEQLRSTIILI